MLEIIHTTSHLAVSLDKTERFRQGIRAISQSAEALLGGIRERGAGHSLVGMQLAGLLKDLRQQRSYSMDLAMGMPVNNEQFDIYIHALGHLRGIVAHWLTAHAANPKTMEVEATEFEMQCFSTLGAGVMWLDSLRDGAQPDALLADEQMLAFIFGAHKEQGAGSAKHAGQMWSRFTTQNGLLAR